MSNKHFHLDIRKPEAGVPLCGLGEQGHCVICSDEVARARVVSVNATSFLAEAAVGDMTLEIDISLVEEVTPGEWVLVQGGVAIGRLGAPDDECSPVKEVP
ncbi:MAG TPA: HypC/HybG/HupF family hydrogenase formation chaperone [Ktedonobacterales bacterium]|nr:HypC/HybG/HupF family hydrogenase formation chaperone [Ktedonobacterales bacterium]